MSRRASLEALHRLLEERGLLAASAPHDRPRPVPGGMGYHHVALAGDPIGPDCLLVDTFSRGRRGRRALRRALRSRPAALLAARTPARDPGLPLLTVTDLWRALAAAAALAEGFPGEPLRVAGITGTNGKTSVSVMLARCLEEAGIRAALVGSATQRVAGRFAPPTLTTPDAVALQALLGRALRAGCSHAVIEVSSHGLSQWRVAEVGFDVAVVTNVSVDHTDYHDDAEDYFEAKARLMTLLRPAGVAIAWAGDPRSVALASRAPRGALRVGTAADCEARLDESGLRLGPALAARLDRAPARVALPLRDRPAHERANAALAATAAFALGASANAIETALAGYPGLPRRAALSRIGGRRVLDDFGSNPASARALFRAVRERGWDEAGVVVVASPRGSRGVRLNRETALGLADALRGVRGVRVVVTAAADAVTRADRVHRAELAAYVGALRRGGIAPRVTRRLRSAVARALSEAPPEALLVLLGAQGMDAGSAAVREWIQGRAPRGLGPWPRIVPEDPLPAVRRAVLPAVPQAVGRVPPPADAPAAARAASATAVARIAPR